MAITIRTCRRVAALSLGLAALAAAESLGAAPALAIQDAAPQPAPAAPKRPDIYDEQANPDDQIAAALRRAKKENRRVLVQWGANWCGWCHLLHEHFKSQPEVARKLLYEYDLVLVDVGRFDKHLELGARYGAEFKTKGLPYLTVLDAEGKVVANQETGALEKAQGDGAPGHDAIKVLEFLSRNQAPYRSAESILEDGLAAARRDGKIVFLHFGAPWCGWCHRLEKWMARDEVTKALARDFVDVKIDTDRTIGGGDVMLRYTKQPKGIPWFAFLAADGTVLAVSEDAQGQNIGCPHAPEEIAIFKKMLGQHARQLSAAEVETICATLGEQGERTDR